MTELLPSVGDCGVRSGLNGRRLRTAHIWTPTTLRWAERIGRVRLSEEQVSSTWVLINVLGQPSAPNVPDRCS
jgi:hypothetical protein